MTISRTTKTGTIGESIACEYLESLGFKVAFRNWKCILGELDIIAKKGGLTVFFEVKSFDKHVYQETGLIPEDNFTNEKQRKFIRACNMFIMKNPEFVDDRHGWRLDLVSVVLPDIQEDGRLPDPSSCKIKHFENVVSWDG